MKNKYINIIVLAVIVINLFTGCSSSTSNLDLEKPIDSTVSCNELTQDIRRFEIALDDKKAKNKLALKERMKFLELAYAIKDARGECPRVLVYDGDDGTGSSGSSGSGSSSGGGDSDDGGDDD